MRFYRGRYFTCCTALIYAALVLGLVVPRSASAADIKVFSLPGMMTAFEVLLPRFEGRTGHKLTATFLVNVPLMRRIDSGDRFDVVVTGIPDFENLIKRGKVISDSRVVIGRTAIGVWTRPGAPKPDISTVESFKKLMLASKSISYTKESGTGVYMARLMERLGIADEMRPKTRLLGGGGQNPRAVAAGEVEYGISIVTDGIGLPGVELLGLLPEEIQRWSIFVAGVATDVNDAAAAREFISFLSSVESASILKEKGWEPSAK